MLYRFIVCFRISPGLALVFADVGVAYTTGLGTLYPPDQNPYYRTQGTFLTFAYLFRSAHKG